MRIHKGTLVYSLVRRTVVESAQNVIPEKSLGWGVGVGGGAKPST